MKKLLFTIMFGIIFITLISSEVQANENNKLIGYNITTEIYESDVFKNADTNNNHFLNFQEYKAVSLKDNEYSTFLLIDSNNDKNLSAEEFESYAAGKGFTTVRDGAKRNWNINSDAVRKKHFVPINRNY